MAWMAGVTPRLDTCLAADCFAKALVCDVIRSFKIVEQEVSFEQPFVPEGLQMSGHSIPNNPHPGSQVKKKTRQTASLGGV